MISEIMWQSKPGMLMVEKTNEMLEAWRQQQVDKEVASLPTPSDRRAMKFSLDIKHWVEDVKGWMEPVSQDNAGGACWPNIEHVIGRLEDLQLMVDSNCDKYRAAKESPLGWDLVRHWEQPTEKFSTITDEDFHAAEEQLIKRDKDIKRIVKGA